MGEQAIRIGLIGFGTIGTGVVKLLQRQRAAIRERLGVDARPGAHRRHRHATRPRREAGARGAGRRRPAHPRRSDHRRRHRADGRHRARRGASCSRRIAAGKDVVTANKALLAHHGDEIFRAAEKRGGRGRLRGQRRRRHPDHPHAARKGLCGDRNQAVYGIVNGTSNFILSRMSDAGGEFADVLKRRPGRRPGGGRSVLRRRRHRRRAQADAAHPARLRRRACPSRTCGVEGIRHVSQADIAFAREFGYVIKSLAVAKRAGDRIEASVQPDDGAAARIRWPTSTARSTPSPCTARRSARACTSAPAPA